DASAPDGRVTVALADEFEAERGGPFHFGDWRDEDRFNRGFAECRARKLGSSNFYEAAGTFHIKWAWSGIPTESNSLSYYALVLPSHAIPLRLAIIDPHSGRQYRRTVTRDDQKQRYVIYLKCSSRFGHFDFELRCEFAIDPAGF